MQGGYYGGIAEGLGSGVAVGMGLDRAKRLNEEWGLDKRAKTLAVERAEAEKRTEDMMNEAGLKVFQSLKMTHPDLEQGENERGEYMITERVELSPGVYGYWITVPEADSGCTILFFHGGGFTFGSTKDHLGLSVRIAKAARAQVFSVDYRLAPEYVFPAAVEDAVAAYRYLTGHGHLPHRIIPIGITSGGNLVIDLLISARDQGLPLPLTGVCISPLVDMLFEGESVRKNLDNDWITLERLNAIKTAYLAGHDPKDPLASPSFPC